MGLHLPKLLSAHSIKEQKQTDWESRAALEETHQRFRADLYIQLSRLDDAALRDLREQAEQWTQTQVPRDVEAQAKWQGALWIRRATGSILFQRESHPETGDEVLSLGAFSQSVRANNFFLNARKFIDDRAYWQETSPFNRWRVQTLWNTLAEIQAPPSSLRSKSPSGDDLDVDGVGKLAQLYDRLLAKGVDIQDFTA